MQYDGAYQRLFSNPEMLEDLVKNFVKEDWVQHLNFSTVERLNSNFYSKELIRREGDLIFKINTFEGKPTYLMLLLEFQSTIDPWMAVRFLVYTGLLYQELIKRNELTNGLLPPVFPLLLYNGNSKWREATEVKKLIDLPKKSPLWPYQPNMRYYMIDENEHLDSGPNSLSGLLFKIEKNRDKEKNSQYLDELIELLQNSGLQQLTRDFRIWVTHILYPKSQLELDFGQYESISEEVSMLKETAEQWKKEYIEVGITQGEIKIIERLMTKRFGPTSPEIHEKLQNATTDELEEWSMRILEAHSIDDVFKN